MTARNLGLGLVALIFLAVIFSNIPGIPTDLQANLQAVALIAIVPLIWIALRLAR